MNNIIYVFNTVLRFMNTTLYFAPFRFTIFQAFACFAIGGIIVSFIRRMFF